MNLKDVFEQLTSGELSQLAIGNLNNGGICEEDAPRIIRLIQTGLTAIYTRFELKQSQILVQLRPGLDHYHLNSKHLMSNPDAHKKGRYLIDNEYQPFKDDVIKITNVLGDNGHPLYLDLRGEPYSIRTMTFNSIRTPSNIMTKAFSDPAIEAIVVEYKANHPMINIDEAPYTSDYYELELPEVFMTALCYYVASRILNPMGMTNEFFAGGSYAAMYERECQRLEMDGVENETLSSEGRFERSGFV